MNRFCKTTVILLVLSAAGLFFKLSSASAVTETITTMTASHASDTSASSPQYISGADLSVLRTVDDATMTSSLLGTSINSSTPTLVFQFTAGYTPPPNEETKSINLVLVYKYNVGSLLSHYVNIYETTNGKKTLCANQHSLVIPSTAATYATDQFDLSGCLNNGNLNTVEVQYFAAALLQPVNTSFDQAVILIKHGDKVKTDSSGDSNKPSNFSKGVDASRNGGIVTRNNGKVRISFGPWSLPYEVNVSTESVVSKLVKVPGSLIGLIKKINVDSSFNGYPIPSFGPSLLFLENPGCKGRPVIVMSTNGKDWKSLFTVRAGSSVAAVIRSPGYYAVTCR